VRSRFAHYPGLRAVVWASVPYVRTVKTFSGAAAVRIVYSSRSGSREIDRLGSAHSDAEVEVLKAMARPRRASTSCDTVRTVLLDSRDVLYPGRVRGSFEALTWGKAVVVAGFAAYLALFVINNLIDPATNSAAVGRMMSMRELRDDPPWGQGVLWRAVDSPAVHKIAYRLVIAAQALTSVVLWWATVMFVRAAITGYQPGALRSAVALADLGLCLFIGIWLSFILTGLWFSYWVNMGPIQQGHLTLLLISIAGTVLVNLTQ
jgi:predicted small integral membrane protein